MDTIHFAKSLSEANQQIHDLRCENDQLKTRIMLLERTIAEETRLRYEALIKLSSRGFSD